MNIWDWTKTWAARHRPYVWIDYRTTEIWAYLRELFVKRGRL